MRVTRSVYRHRIAVSAAELFRWHARPGALARLTPPWQPIEIVDQSGGIEVGGRVELLVGIGPFRLRWVAEHVDCQPEREFRDRQVIGPFQRWVHTHRFEPVDHEISELIDQIDYALPFGRLGHWLAGGYVQRRLAQLFRYRHNLTELDLAAHRARTGGFMRVLITGATGLVGSALIPFLTTGGHTVTKLVRRAASSENEICWQPEQGKIDRAPLEGFDAVVHLAGDNVAEGRWSAEKKARIRDSRIRPTRLLAETLASLKQPPKVLVSASATGFYGNRGDELLREESTPANDFLGEVCREWEAATEPASAAGIRVVNLRIGVVLTAKGGALAKMLTPFKIGVGGVMGSGSQYMSWITIDDLIGVIYHAINDQSLRGPVNAVSPNPVTNRDFTKTLGHVLSRPTIFPMPAFAAKLAFGEMAEALLLSSTRVQPARLLESKYQFRHSDLDSALRAQLGNS